MGEFKLVVFHGSCLGCTQQEIHDVDFCFDCQNFEGIWSKKDLSNQPPTRGDIVRAEVKRRRKRVSFGAVANFLAALDRTR